MALQNGCVELPAQIKRAFPESTVIPYAALQSIQAEYVRTLDKGGENQNKAKERLSERLLRFASDYPEVPRYCWCRTPVPYRAQDGVEVLPWRTGLDRLEQF